VIKEKILELPGYGKKFKLTNKTLMYSKVDSNNWKKVKEIENDELRHSINKEFGPKSLSKNFIHNPISVMRKKYKSEIEAMRDFYEVLDIIPDYSCNTDGRVNGTLVEIKRNDSGGLPIKQLKRYIKSYNAVALPLPRYSLVIYINQRKFVHINNINWTVTNKGKWKDPQDLQNYLNNKEYMKGKINEYSIVAYNDLFYSKHLSAKKEDFIEEIKTPKELNIEPYSWNKTGDMERSMLDCLGSTALKRRLGAFFTPDEYVEKSTGYLRSAISRVPEDYDYIILDRCAGTGNLQKFLTSEELSHCILNTYVYAEWTT